MKTVDEYFACNVFSKHEMQKYLPNSVFKKLNQVMEYGEPLPAEIADVVANAMKDWAMEKAPPIIPIGFSQ